jgi:hypothetical protein
MKLRGSKQRVCSVCLVFINTDNGKIHDLCEKCSPYAKEPNIPSEPSFDLVSEISPGRINTRLMEGFNMLGYE